MDHAELGATACNLVQANLSGGVLAEARARDSGFFLDFVKISWLAH